MTNREYSVIAALADPYDLVCYVDIASNELQMIRVSGRFTDPEILGDISAGNTISGERFDRALKALVEDLPAFLRSTDRGHNMALLREGKHPSFLFRAKPDRDGVSHVFRLTFAPDLSSDNVIVGIRGMDAELREEELRALRIAERQRRLEEKDAALENELRTVKAVNAEIERLVAMRTSELNEKNRILNHMSEGVLEMIGNLVESRSEESGKHVRSVKGYTYVLASQVRQSLPEYGLTEEDVRLITFVSPLHDLGKLTIPDAVLLKPGRLTPDEFEIMKTHAEKGSRILERMRNIWSDEYIATAKDICLYHHEKWNGEGYPAGLKGDEIPIAAQIVSIADIYDALTNERCYKAAYSPDEAYAMIMAGECGSFSEKLLACFTRCRESFAAYAADPTRRVIIDPDEKSGFSAAAQDAGGDYLRNTTLISASIPFLKEISESMPGGFFVYRAENGRLLAFNDLMVSYFGCASRAEFAEYIGNSFRGIVHPEDYEATDRSIWAQISTGTDNFDHVIYRIIRKNGEIRWMDDYGHLIHSDDLGDVFVVFVLDITEAYSRSRTVELTRVAEEERNKIRGLVSQGETPEGTKKILYGTNVLLVDDSELSCDLNREILEEKGASVTVARNGKEAVNAVLGGAYFDLILMDIVMPVMNGIDAAREIRAYEAGAGIHTPIIALTADGHEGQVAEMLRAGAYECLYKPLNVTELSGVLLAHSREVSRQMEQQLAKTIRMANTDPLTHVKSITAYTDKIAELTVALTEDPAAELGVVLCDCDDLKGVNDSLGHDAGDSYIKNCCGIICRVFAHSPVYRVGGDEFVALLQGEDYRNAAELMAELKNTAAEASRLADVRLGRASLSCGYAAYDPKIDKSVSDTIKRADTEMYRSKRAQK